MCRWLAYNGPPIYLDAILFKPENSLIRQSLRALRSKSVTNGDGFGIGWYGTRREPGLFRDTLPAWNDENLRSLSEQDLQARIKSVQAYASHLEVVFGETTKIERRIRAYATSLPGDGPMERFWRRACCGRSAAASASSGWIRRERRWPSSGGSRSCPTRSPSTRG